MNSTRPQKFEKNRSQNDFLACKKLSLLLQNKIEMAVGLFRQKRSFKFIGLFERRLISIHSQAGVFLLRRFASWSDPMRCGMAVSEPLDAGVDKFFEMNKLEIVA
jgi:hypothetical protein